MIHKLITLCCGEHRSKYIIFSNILSSTKCFCLKCKKESILINKKENKNECISKE